MNTAPHILVVDDEPLVSMLIADWLAGWAGEDSYVDLGPIQFFGPEAITDSITHTLALEQG